MHSFEQLLFEKQTEKYAGSGLTDEEYGDIYYVMKSLRDLPESAPYLYAMEYFGLGRKATPEQVIEKLEEVLSGDDVMLKGLYYDLRMLGDEDNASLRTALDILVSQGYNARYLKDKSHVKGKAEGKRPEQEPVKERDTEKTLRQTSTSGSDSKSESEQAAGNVQSIEVTNINIAGDGRNHSEEFNGDEFVTGDISYLKALIYIEPLREPKHIHVQSQIFKEDKAFSKMFEDDISLQAGDNWLRTTGWGNKNFNGYPGGTYRWESVIDGKKYSKEFVFRSGYRVEQQTIKEVGIQTPKTKPDQTVIPSAGLEWMGFRITLKDALDMFWYHAGDLPDCPPDSAGSQRKEQWRNQVRKQLASVSIWATLQIIIRSRDHDFELYNSTWLQELRFESDLSVFLGGDDNLFVFFTKKIGVGDNTLPIGLYEYTIQLGTGKPYVGTFTVV